MATTRQPSAIAQIEEQEQLLLVFRTRFIALKAFETELIARTGTRVFNIANTVVWDAMFAQRDQLVIHFASWIKAFTRNGGFFGQLAAHHLGELRAGFEKARNETSRINGRERRWPRIAERFPDAAERGVLNPEHLDRLRSTSYDQLVHVIDDRDEHRAHPYERARTGTARMLNLDDIAGALDSAEHLLNDLRLLASNSTLGYSYQSLTNPQEAAADLVDLLLFGSTLRFATIIGANALEVSSAYWWQRRDAFLAALRIEHDANPELPMNDETFIEAAKRQLVPTSPTTIG